MCTGISIRCISCRHVGYKFSATCDVIGCLNAQSFVQLLPRPGFCPNCSPLTLNISGFYFEHPEVATLCAQALSFLRLFHRTEIKEDEEGAKIQWLEKVIKQLSGSEAGDEAGAVTVDGSGTEQQQMVTDGSQSPNITPDISKLRSRRVLAAAFEALRNDLDDREDFWVEHIRAIEIELKLAFGSVDWAEVIWTQEELEKLRCIRQSGNL